MGSDGGSRRPQSRTSASCHALVPQGISADLIATLEGFTREDCDRFALDSPEARQGRDGRRALRQEPRAGAESRPARWCSTDDEYPAPRNHARGARQARAVVRRDGRVRDRRTARRFDEKAVKALPADGERSSHVHTAGNSSGIVDGAGSGAARLAGLRARRTARSRARASARPRRAAPSRSSC